MEERRVVPGEGNNGSSALSLFDFGGNLDKAWRFAEVLSKSQIVPDTFRGNPASCLIALDMANRMRRNPLEIMQALQVIHGKPTFSSTFLIALINSSGFYERLRFRFEGEGDARSCTAWTKDLLTGEVIEGPTISIKMAKEELWYARNGSKWKTMPEVMLRYRAASFFQRTNCPDVAGGFHTIEEAQDMDPGTVNLSASKNLQAELLEISARKQPAPEASETAAALPAVEAAPMDTGGTIDPEMIDFPLPEPTVPATQAAPPSAKSEVERLREQLVEGLTLGRTDEEAEAWIREHFNKSFKALTKDDLKAAIAKLNEELDAREGV